MIWLWAGFILLVLFLLAFDLGVLNRTPHVIGAKEALYWTSFWVSLALLFNVAVYFLYENHVLGLGTTPGYELSGWDAALQFFTGYLVEESLSLDNIFVIALIFRYFGVPPKYQHRVLFWGIIGAQVMRGAMIGLGTALIHRFDWIIYVFGVLLIVTAVRLFFTKNESVHPESNLFVKLARRFLPTVHEYHEEKFFVRVNGKLAMTPLFLALIIVETTDVAFAIDSIPAIFAITRDPFIVFTSNVFAILGLRSLYFALAAILDKFRYLKVSLVFLLAFVGIKMLLSHHYPIPTHISLTCIVGFLAAGILVSIIAARRETSQSPHAIPRAD